MATYFHGNSEIQGGGDGLQTLILMNPGYVGYSEPPQSSNFVFLNSNSSANNPQTLTHAPPTQTHHFVGIPLQGATSASPQDHPPPPDVHGFLPRVHYNLYNLPIELGATREVTTRASQQGLSLTLSSQQPPGYGSREIPVSPPRTDRGSGGSPSSASGVSNGVQSMILSSKYLKAAQELLDEVVNVGKTGTVCNVQTKIIGNSSAAASGDGQSGGGEGSAKRVVELTTAERQEIQMKKAKLVNMLDEVEQRYRQYHHQMQIVITWFERAAGIGSAKTYTALALQTISKQFRCLKDAILAQIRAATKTLGEDDTLEAKIEGSRLKYVDNQIRQQRALQQLGMIQHNAWRPQRGLPERSVSVLRAWLFEHFLHPYPKDSDKLMLAKQTGLTRSQVSNWFINARVRLWKPMVEEMYKEEMKEHEKNGSETSDQNEDPCSKSSGAQQHPNSPATENQDKNLISKQDNHMNQNGGIGSIAAFNLIGSSDIETITQGSPKKLRNATNMLQSEMKFGDDRQGRETGFTLMGAPTNFIGGFGSYPIGDLGRFGTDQFQAPPYSGNGTVSLTLGLPHCENLGAHQTFLPNQTIRGVEIGEANEFNGINNPANGNVYDDINRKRFAAQLLPDFVA